MRKPDEYNYLEKLATGSGAIDAKVIPAECVVVENRALLKCRSGCPSYGTCLKCPPYVPSPDEFRKMLAEYHHVMVVKYRLPVPDDLVTGGAQVTPELQSFLAEHRNMVLAAMLELEKAAFSRGNAFAVALVGGSCKLCEGCDIEAGLCRHPARARIAAEAMGVNVIKTAENAGMIVSFLPGKPPEPVAILLID